ncbi:MAG TPA: 3-oxoacyl-[acyl-carrier-protein] synthase III C-terminal domain-containing protein [Gemmatimonadaceae bacterium]|nr:3-oxoacyl-[acyl-carrier-protein] synthase III C-terminal domain-containing protein [Gemmatimonadaceae bacterium]
MTRVESNGQSTPAIAGISYVFPERSRTVGELAGDRQLNSSASTMESFGFGKVHVAVTETPYELALAASTRLLDESRVDRDSIGLLIYGGTPGSMSFAAQTDAEEAASGLCTMSRFKFPATRLQYDLGLHNAWPFAVDQLSCTTLLGAARLARSLCLTEGIERALCVSSEFFPANAGREAIFNCTSDAACAILIERNGTRNRLVSATNVTKGYYWDIDALRDEIVASYFPTARHVLLRTISDAGWEPADVDWIIPHNVSMRSWQILSSLVRLPRARLFSDNIARHGHTLAGDNFINYRDALDGGCIQPGHRVVLFSYGFGAHWTGVAVEA